MKERVSERLARAEAHYRRLVLTSPHAIYALDTDGRFIELNAAGGRLLGRAPEELLGEHFERIIPPDELAYAQEVFRRTVAGLDAEQTIELSLRRPSGELRLSRISLSPIVEDGVVTGIHGLAQDITAERKTAREREALLVALQRSLDEVRRKEEAARSSEARARESEEFLQRLVDSLSAHVAVLDADGRIVAVNAAWETFARENGADAATAGVGANYLETCAHASGDDAATARAALAGLQQVLTGEERQFTLEYECSSPAEERWFALRATRFVGSGPIRIVVSHETITERRLAERSRQRSELRFRSLFEHNPAAVFLLDPDAAIRDVNPACERLSGYAASELRGRRACDFVAPSDLEFATAAFSRAVEGTGESYEHGVINRAGATLQVRVTAVPVIIDDRVDGVFVMAENMAEQRRLEAQLRQAQKLEALGRLSGGVAHEFNNVLTVIGGHAAMALDDLPPSHPLRPDMEEIQQSTRRAAALTHQLLAFSRKQVVNPSVFNLNDVLGDMQRMLRRLVSAGVSLDVRETAGLWSVSADRGQFEQVVLNLVINACDAVDSSRGHVTVRTSNRRISGGGVGLPPHVQPGEYACLEVQDDGVGMTADTLARIFDPFFTTKDVGRGTGLGLSTVHGIVEQAGGYVWAVSEPGAGSTFTVLLPRAFGAGAGDEESRLPAAWQGADEVVLVVDDEPAVRTLVSRVLRRAGYRVLEAGSPLEALDVAGRHDGVIELILTDVVMPQMSGRELAERVRTMRPDTRVVFMSGYVEEALRHEDVLASGGAFLPKPFTPDAVCRLVAAVLGRAV